MTVALTPERIQAIQFYNQAVLLNDSDAQMAYKLLMSAIDADATLPEAWKLMADKNADMALRRASIACYRRYLQLQPEDGKAWCSLGHMLYHAGDIGEAEFATKRSISLDKNLANAWMNLSMIDTLYGRVSQSVDSAKRGYELDPTPITELALGFAYLFARKLDLGLKHFEAKIPYKMPKYFSFPWPKWSGEDISNKTLYVISDQGLGDSLNFLRFVPQAAARAAHIVMHIQPELMRLAMLMLVDVPNITFIPINSPLPTADMWTAITSVPVALGLSSKEIEHAPMLSIPLVESLESMPPPIWWRVPSAKYHVGICWAGAALNDIDRWRSMSIEDLLELADVPGVQLYSLQVGPRAPEVYSSGSSPVVKDAVIGARDVLDTALIMQQLDLVVSVDSLIAHLANAIGKDVFVLCPFNSSDWRLGRKGQKDVWHPHSMRFFQGPDASWEPVVRAAKAELTKRAAATR